MEINIFINSERLGEIISTDDDLLKVVFAIFQPFLVFQVGVFSEREHDKEFGVWEK